MRLMSETVLRNADLDAALIEARERYVAANPKASRDTSRVSP